MANLPTPVVGAGGQGSRGLGESLLLTLASSAPGLLMQFLNMRQQATDQEAQGQAATGVLAELARQGTISPELFTSAGGSITPGQTVQGVTTPSGIKAPTVSTQTRVDATGINTRVAPQLLQQALSTQQATSAIDANKAQTAATVASTKRDDELHPLRVQQIKESLISEKFNRDVQARTLKLTEQKDRRQAGNEAAALQLDAERVRLQRSEALQNVQARLSNIHADQMSRFTNMAQLYASAGMAPDAARARASADIFGSTQPVKLDEFLAANVEKATAGILTGQADPDSMILKTVFGDRPDVQYGSKIGLAPEAIEFINQRLEATDGDGSAVLAEAAKTLTLEGEARDQELAKMVLYLSYKTGSKIAVPAAKESGSIRRALRALMQGASATQASAASILGNTDNISINGLFAKPTPEQLEQMNSGFIRGWAPPAK